MLAKPSGGMGIFLQSPVLWWPVRRNQGSKGYLLPNSCRKAKPMRAKTGNPLATGLIIENLEDRIALAGDVLVAVDAGNVVVHGDDQDNQNGSDRASQRNRTSGRVARKRAMTSLTKSGDSISAGGKLQTPMKSLRLKSSING